MLTPKCNCYYPRYTGNYGQHAMCFNDPHGNIFYFSYQTLIGFYSEKLGKSYFRQNQWHNTTSRHMCQLSRKEERLPQEAFEAMLRLAFESDRAKVYKAQTVEKICSGEEKKEKQLLSKKM